MEGDFEDLFADEMEAMREMEELERTQGFSQNSAPVKTICGKVHVVTGGSQFKSASQFAKPQLDTPDPSPEKIVSNKPVLNGESRKRGLEEMFGALSSDSEDELVIDVPKQSPFKKKAKTEGVPTINREPDKDDDFKITPPPSPQKSQPAKMTLKQQKDNTETFTSQVHYRKERAPPKVSSQVLKRQPDGPSVTITASDGRRVYLTMKEEEKLGSYKQTANKVFDQSYKTMGLLQTSISALMDEVEEMRHQQILRESERLTNILKETRTKMSEDAAVMADEDATTPEDQNATNLWVDRYSPRHFTELLSDDGVNRNLLFWLKMWDHVVFGKEKKQAKEKPAEKNKKQNAQTKKFKQEDQLEEFDDHDRPKLIIALLCGPPGLGKTTLAHVIAKHAGYNVVEMNASDDRSIEVFKTKIENATQMSSVLALDQRPNCMIIDEIDGAPLPTINYFVNMLKGTDTKEQGKKKKKKRLLRRPIICICNDAYVPALRQLRQMAYVTHFPPTISARLATRLYQIAKDNTLKTDLTTLIALCSKADNDIRSCLNTLQFLHSQGEPVKLSTVHSLTVGQKDQHKGLFTTWQDIFQLPRPKRKQYANPHDIAAGRANVPKQDQAGEGNPQSLTARFHKILHLVQGCGEYEKLVQGIFENYLEVKFKDPHLEGINIACDWLTYFDVLQSEIMHSQNYIFNRYLPFTPVVFHMLFATLAKPQIKYPSSQYENFQKATKISNLVETMLSDVAPSVASSTNLRLAVTDLIPLLLTIIQPSFRPINIQLFSIHEKRQLSELINIMLAYNLTYHQERNMEGQYNYVLDPNLEEVTKFSDTPPTRPMTYAAKQLIAREIELEKFRRAEGDAPVIQPSTKESSKPPQPSSEAKADEKPAIPRHKQKLAPKKIEQIEDKPVRDFFARFKRFPKTIPKPETEGKEPARSEQLVTGNVWFKFNQGFTNAVRKTVKIQDLL